MKDRVHKSERTSRLNGYLMVAVAATSFGVNGTLSRFLLDDGVSPVTLVEFRMLLGWICLCALLLVSKQGSIKLPVRHWGWIIAFGIAIALVTYCYFLAISRLPIAMVLVIQFSAVAWMTIGESIWRRRLPSVIMLMAIVFALGGVVLVTDVWQTRLGGLDTLGLFYAFCALITYVAYLLLGRRVGQQVPALYSVTWGAFVASVFWLIIQPPWAIPASTWQTEHMVLIALVGTIGMAIPYALFQGALRRVDAARVGVIAMLELVASGVIAYFWLGQHLNVWQIMGCVLVLIGVAILQYEQ